MFPSRVTRRQFMTRSAAAAGGLFISSCFGDRLSTSPTPRPTYGTPISKVKTRWPIDRVVYLMLENRSFDNLFGRYPGARGVRTGVRSGQEVNLIRCPEWLPGDLAHDTASWHAMYNDGKMDGFALGAFGPYFAYSQFERRDVPNYFRWADRFVLCDNFFASVAGPSHPNHLFMIAGQAGGAIDNPENIRVKHLNDGRQSKSWGCDAYGDGVFINVKDGQGNINKHSTCFDMKTVGHQLSKRDIDWAFYSADPYQAGYIWQAYASIDDIYHNPETWEEHIWPVDDLMRDIQAKHPAPRYVDHAAIPAVGSPSVQHQARPQLGHRHRERHHALGHVGAHGDLHHVGRMGRVL